jgi:hypothetical protein
LFVLFAIAAASSSSSEHQTAIASTPKSTNGSTSKVLHRVISLTTANHNDNFTKTTNNNAKSTLISEKLQFTAYEKFEGENFCLNCASVNIGVARQDV